MKKIGQPYVSEFGKNNKGEVNGHFYLKIKIKKLVVYNFVDAKLIKLWSH